MTEHLKYQLIAAATMATLAFTGIGICEFFELSIAREYIAAAATAVGFLIFHKKMKFPKR